MKRTLHLLVVLLAVVSMATAQSVTPNLNLTLPAHGAANWDTIMNSNLTKIDTSVGALVNVYQGNWSSGTTYNKGQQVFYSNTYYISTQNGNIGNTPSPTSYWWTTYLSVIKNPIGAVYQVDQFTGTSWDVKLGNCLSVLPSTGGLCDGRNFNGGITLSGNIVVSVPNAHIYLPCATITTAYQFIVAPGIRNVVADGCSFQGGSTSSGTSGGTVWVYTGNYYAFQIGDTSGGQNTPGFFMHDVNINTATAGSAAGGIYFERTQEVRLDNIYLNGNNTTGQTGVVLDGTGNYAGGTFIDVYINGFGTGWELTGDTSGNWANASTFLKTHVVCANSSGSPITGTFGINLVEGDGNTWAGGDVEQCDTMFHLGSHAVNNTINGLRNEVSNTQYLADSGSSFNAVFTGGTLYTGALVDNGSRNSFWDAFHRDVNGIKGDWYASQQDATVTNHQRIGIGLGNERGIQEEIQTDYGYRWEYGLSDGTSGLQTYFIDDLINNLPRFSIAQYLSSTPNVVTNVLTSNGGCYSSSTPPTISFSGGGGTGAAATATMSTNSSQTCNSGSGYQVSQVSMSSGGSGYTSSPTVTFSGSNQITAPGGVVAEITLSGSTNNQTVINSAGTGAVIVNGSTNAGSGGFNVSSGGATPVPWFYISSSGNTYVENNLNVLGTVESYGTVEVRNQADAEVDYALWAGQTTSQKESLTYKDYNGASQWYLTKDTTDDWALESAVSGIDAVKAYQSTNSGDLYLDANSSGTIRLNYETGSGTSTVVYNGGSSSSNKVLVLSGPGLIQLPGMAASSGHACLHVDTSGWLSNTGTDCGSGTSTMVYPAAGIAVSTGGAWTSSLTPPASAIVGISDTQTLTNKSIASTEITGLGTSATVNTGTSGAVIPLLSTANTWSTTQTLTAAPVLSALTGYVYGNGSSAATASTTIPNTAITGLGTSSTVNTGTSGAVIPLLSTANTWTTTQTFSAAPINAALTGYVYANGSSAETASTTIPNTSITGLGTSSTVNTGTSGATIPLLNGSNTWSANTTTFANNSANPLTMIIQPGTSSSVQNAVLQFNNAAATPVNEWQVWTDSSYDFQITCESCTHTLPAFVSYYNASTGINSYGSSSVVFNNNSNSGTGGVYIYEGGSNNNVVAFGVSSSAAVEVGGASGTGNLAIGNHLNQIATADYAGTCAMSSGTTCTISLQHSYTSTPLCFTQSTTGNTYTATCAVSSNTITVTAGTANSYTWQALVIGNPN